MRETEVNPIIKTDYPDPDVIRVNDTYYMASTTMHFYPGGAILRSYDLINWEVINYIFDSLDNNTSERMELEATNYGCGMWAPSLRYHNGIFYCLFVSHKTQKTFLFTTKDILGKWERKEVKGYYHDASLLFDDDGRVYLTSGNTDIWLTELESDLSGPKTDGINKIIVTDKSERILGYEGSHFYKINGRYYVFLIHWLKNGTNRRVEACYSADSLDSGFTGGDILDDDMGFFNQGVAQGGIVDTPAGKWYAVLFRDNGAVGRIPVVVPVTFKDNMPVFGKNGKVPINIDIASSRPYYRYEPLFTSDSFEYEVKENPNPKLKLQWQWNHTPDNSLWSVEEGKGLRLTTGKLCANVTHARNTLTQRCMYPKCDAEVTVDATNIKDGDVAGICLLQGAYGLIGVTKEAGAYYLVNICRPAENYKNGFNNGDYLPGILKDKERLSGPLVRLCIRANFEDLADKADFFYEKEGKWVKVGNTHKLIYTLDHFVGARFGLFNYSTKEYGGYAYFKDFEYRYNM